MDDFNELPDFKVHPEDYSLEFKEDFYNEHEEMQSLI